MRREKILFTFERKSAKRETKPIRKRTKAVKKDRAEKMFN